MLFNIALLAKWIWDLFKENEDGLWHEVLVSEYGGEYGGKIFVKCMERLVTQIGLRSVCSVTWLNLRFCFLFCSFVIFRRMRGGRRLWESKDDRKWGHDKFEEITLQERHYKEVMSL